MSVPNRDEKKRRYRSRYRYRFLLRQYGGNGWHTSERGRSKPPACSLESRVSSLDGLRMDESRKGRQTTRRGGRAESQRLLRMIVVVVRVGVERVESSKRAHGRDSLLFRDHRASRSSLSCRALVRKTGDNSYLLRKVSIGKVGDYNRRMECIRTELGDWKMYQYQKVPYMNEYTSGWCSSWAWGKRLWNAFPGRTYDLYLMFGA